MNHSHNKNRYDIIIIGAGIIGASISLSAARKGYSVLCLDAGPGAGYGSTSGSCAIIRPYYSTVDGSAIAYESHYYWKNWAEHIGVNGEHGLARYINCGCLVMKTRQNKFLKPACSIMDEIGAPYSHLSADEVSAKLPVNTEAFAPAKTIADPQFGISNGDHLPGGVLFHSGGYVTDPQLATHNIQRAAEAAGAVFRFNARVNAIEQKAGKTSGVSTESGQSYESRVVVNAAGPHSYKINQLAGVEEGMNIKTRALRHEVAHVPSPENFDFGHNGCVFSDSDIATYLRPEHGNHILIGSEDPPCDTPQWVDPDTFDRNFSEQWKTLVMRAAQRIPELPIPGQAKGVVELYDVSDDWIPIYDKSDLDGFYMAIGTSGNQFKNAPIVGEMMADMIEAGLGGRNQDTDPIDFHLKYINRTVNTGFYSRLREVNKDSSFSVLG
jgi:sarcosine oxidase subunit beta